MTSEQSKLELTTFSPLITAAAGLDLSDAEAARAELVQRFDPTSQEADALNQELIQLLEAGQIAERGELPVRFGRVCKATPESQD